MGEAVSNPRKINLIVVHCSATREGQPHTAADIDRWHRGRGWGSIGYHWVIRLDGTLEMGRPEDLVGAHAYGHNGRSIGVVYIGGVAADGVTPKDTRTAAQKAALKRLLPALKERYPNARICGHRDLSPDRNHDGRITPNEWMKACPSFDVAQYLTEIGLANG